MVGSLLNNMNDPFARIETDQSLVDFTHFGGSKAFDTMGFADSDGASNGRAGTQEVDGNRLEKLERQRQKREERDKTNELIELGAQLRQARIAGVFDGLSEEVLDFAVDETLKNIDEVTAKHNLDPQQKAQLESWLITYKTSSPEEQERILGKIAENYPGVAEEMANRAREFQLNRDTNKINAQESENAEKSAIQDDAEFRDVVSNETTAEEAAGIAAMREGSSFASSDFMSSLKAGVGPSAEFNAQAAGISTTSVDQEPIVAKIGVTIPTAGVS